MFDILEGIIKHIMLVLHIPNRPCLTAIVKWILITTILFLAARVIRFFQSFGSAYLLDDAKLCIALGFFLAAVSLFFELIEKKE